MKGFRYPDRGRNNYLLVLTLYKHGPFTFEQGMKIHGHFSPKRGVTRQIYDKAVQAGHVVMRGYKYYLPEHMKAWAAKRVAMEEQEAADEAAKPKADLVPARQVNVFKGNGYKPAYMQCLRQQPEWAKPDSFAHRLA